MGFSLSSVAIKAFLENNINAVLDKLAALAACAYFGTYDWITQHKGRVQVPGLQQSSEK